LKLCNETITVYNAKYDKTADADVYIKTVIIGVSWFCEIATNVDKDGLKAANKFIIRIPEDADFGGKDYAKPSDYAKAQDVSKLFTLKAGDIVVKGIATETSPKPADLHKLYNDVTTILGVTDNRRAPHGKHWKVVGA